MSPRSKEQFEQIRKERKEQILDAALHVFAEDSYHLASMSKIAKRAKVSKGLIYNYFEGKEAILIHLVEGLFDDFMEIMPIEMGEKLTREKFIQLIEISVDEVLKNPEKWKLYMSLSFQPDVTPLLLEKMMPKVQPMMVSLSEYFQEKGHENPMAMMRYYSAVLDGVQMHLVMDPENFPIEEVKKLLIKQFA